MSPLLFTRPISSISNLMSLARKHKLSDVVFLAISQGFEARFLLRTSVLKELRSRASQVVILSPNSDEESFRKEFEADNVHIEKLRLGAYEKYYSGSRIQRGFRVLRYRYLGGKDTDLTPLDDKGGGRGIRGKPSGRLVGYLWDLLLGGLRQHKILRWAFLQLENRLCVPRVHQDLFDHYRPRLVVVPGIGYYHADTYIVREGQRNGALGVSVVYGWDKAYSQGYGGIVPDSVVCWSPAMKEEIKKFQEIPSEQLHIAGNPYFDMYGKRMNSQSKESWCNELGLDPNRSTILFATKSPNSYPNHLICRMLARIINSEQLTKPCQLLVRLHPIHLNPSYTRTEYSIYANQQYEDISKSFDHVAVYCPQAASEEIPMDLRDQESTVIAHQLTNSDVVVTLFSTIMLEAFCLGVPVINIGFDVKDPNLSREFRPIRVDMDQIHLRRIIASDSTWVVGNEAELITALDEALEHPEARRDQMEAVLRSECGPVDGNSGERVATIIADMLEGK